jgi:hypothetical protein
MGDDVLPKLATRGLHPRIPGISMDSHQPLQHNLTDPSFLVWVPQIPKNFQPPVPQ